MIKTLTKVGIEGTSLDIRDIYVKPKNSIMLNGEWLMLSTLPSGVRKGCPLPLPLFNISLEVLPRSIKRKKKKKKRGTRIGKEEANYFYLQMT